MKRKTAKEILAESFREIAEKKPVDKITVQNIVDNCDYSPATFYCNFRDKYDLIAWNHARGVAEIMDRISETYTWNQTLIDGAKWFYAEKEYLANLLQHTTGHDSFVRYMTNINCDALKKYILTSSDKEKLTAKEELLVRAYGLGTVSLTCEWIIGKIAATPEEIAFIYEEFLPLSLREYLIQ